MIDGNFSQAGKHSCAVGREQGWGEPMPDRIGHALEARIGEILLRDWDPIGIADVPAAQDEYHASVAQIATAVRAGLPASVIADHLTAIETERMSLPADRARALRVADCLKRLPHG